MSTVASRTARQAFTLVELLVVIGIIAVLISILLPSLSRARQQANMVSCLSNLRQIGQTLQLYTNDNKGFLPFGRGPDNTGATPARRYVTTWAHELSQVVGIDVGTDGTKLAPMLRCPETFISGAGNGAFDDYRYHYMVNPRLMPDIADTDAAGPVVSGKPDIARGSRTPVRRQLATVEDGTAKFLVWDGAQVIQDNWTNGANGLPSGNSGSETDAEGNNNASIYSGGLDGDAWTAAASHRFCDPAEDSSNLDRKIYIGNLRAYNTNDATKQENLDANKDDANNFMRFRHINNSQMGVLMCDGHAEQRSINAVTKKEVCVNWK